MSRLRLTLAFAAAAALLVAVAGLLLYAGVRSALDEQVDASLEARWADVATLVRESGGDPGPLPRGEESFAEVVRPGEPSLLGADDLERARDGAIFVERPAPPGVDGDQVRLYARAVGDVVVVTGATLEDRDEALGAVRTRFLIGAPIVLLLAAVGGYALAAATLRPVLRRLESGLARERRFAADASHELRTPLASLKAELDLALRRPRSADELRGAIASAAEETDRLALLADDLLLLARADEGALALRPEPVRVRELLEGVARRFRARAGESGRSLGVHAEDALAVRGDRLRLEQALGNLVDNALRHGGGDVRLGAGRAGGGVELSVADEGTGFPPDLLPRAFERFARADDARATGGTGLGLALVDAIARAHGGTAAAANRPGGGAVVTLVLPA